MKRVGALIAVIGVAMIFVLGSVAGALAHPWNSRDGYARHMRVAYADMATSYAGCRVGWWQTLAYGHVRPRWGSVCR